MSAAHPVFAEHRTCCKPLSLPPGLPWLAGDIWLCCFAAARHGVMNAHRLWRVTAIAALTALAALAPWLFISEGRRPAVLTAARPHSSMAASAGDATADVLQPGDAVTRMRLQQNFTSTSALALWQCSIAHPGAHGRMPSPDAAAERVIGTLYTGNWTRQQEYQDRIIAETAIFRPEGGDVNAMFPRFYDYWLEQRANRTDMGRSPNAKMYRTANQQRHRPMLSAVLRIKATDSITWFRASHRSPCVWLLQDPASSSP